MKRKEVNLNPVVGKFLNILFVTLILINIVLDFVYNNGNIMYRDIVWLVIALVFINILD